MTPYRFLPKGVAGLEWVLAAAPGYCPWERGQKSKALLAAQLTRLEQEFGMTLSARTRISVPGVTPVCDPGKASFSQHPG